MELLKQHYEEASSKASQSRTPLHPIQQKSTMNSTPTSSSNITIMSRMRQHSSQEQSAHRSAPNTLIPSKQPAVADKGGDGALSSTGCGKETSSKQQNCHSKCRKVTTNSEDATASTSNHLKKQLHGQNSKQSIDQLPQPSPTNNDIINTGNSNIPVASAGVTMTTEVMEMYSTKEASTEVTPEQVTLSSCSTTKRRLKLEEGASCRPQTKRRRTSTRDSSGKKCQLAILGRSLQKDNSGQRTMQSYFQPVQHKSMILND